MKTLHCTLTRLGVMGLVMGCAGSADQTSRRSPPVRPGIEVLLSDRVDLVAGRRIGLVTNHAGVDSRGVHDVERLRAAGLTITALFSPEHGFRGAAAPGDEFGACAHDPIKLAEYISSGRFARRGLRGGRPAKSGLC